MINAGLVTRQGTLTRSNVAASKVMVAERILANIEAHRRAEREELRLEETVAAQKRCEYKLQMELQSHRLRVRMQHKIARDAKRATTSMGED
jgi:hypothetical protein